MISLLSARYFDSRRRLRNPGVDCRCGASAKISSANLVSRRSRAHGGFTLIELLVAISIIALLVGISAFGALTVQRGAQRNKVKAMFESLQASQVAYQAGTGSRINHVGGAPIDWTQTFNANAPGASGSAVGTSLSSSERFVVACLQHPDSDSAMRAATNAKSVLVDANNNGFLEIRDPWDTPILYLTINDQTGTTDGENNTGTTDGENNNQFPIHRDPFFVSAGQDKTFGTDDDITSNEIGS